MRQKCYITLATGRACGLSRISYAYLTWVAMWDIFFRQRAYIGITQSCMRWYVRKYPYQSVGKIRNEQLHVGRTLASRRSVTSL